MSFKDSRISYIITNYYFQFIFSFIDILINEIMGYFMCFRLVFESGVSKGMFGTCVTGDIFTISYQGTGTAINYYRNGELLLTSTQSAAITVPLYLDSSFKTYGSTFNAVSFAPA